MNGAAGRLAGKCVLITGGTSGMGEASMRLFLAEGARVAFTGRRRERGQALAAELDTRYIEADHADPGTAERVVREAVDALGRIDVLFNNAGVVPFGTAEETPDDVWERTLDVNVDAVWRLSRLVVPLMREQGGGVIVNNASDAGIVGAAGSAAYCASKGAVVLLTRAMALDHAREGIRINALCPGETYVERWDERGDFADEPKETVLERLGDAIPMGRVAAVEEMARAALFLACDDSSYMTGQCLTVDGGNTAR
jgi:meso-butanediol dehydrogenase/(S,S)-butanediol dehydrogenase/diacetyl reductase